MRASPVHVNGLPMTMEHAAELAWLSRKKLGTGPASFYAKNRQTRCGSLGFVIKQHQLFGLVLTRFVDSALTGARPVADLPIPDRKKAASSVARPTLGIGHDIGARGVGESAPRFHQGRPGEAGPCSAVRCDRSGQDDAGRGRRGRIPSDGVAPWRVMARAPKMLIAERLPRFD